MPKFDRTGPLGQGPRTGRSFGSCGGGMGYGRGLGGGFGMGYGRRQFFTKKEEKEVLEDELVDLEKEIQAVKERLSELK